MPLRRLPLLLLALSLPVTTSYGRVYSLSPHLGDVGGGMRVNLTGRDFVDYGDVRCRFGTNAWTRATVDTATSMHWGGGERCATAPSGPCVFTVKCIDFSYSNST